MVYQIHMYICVIYLFAKILYESAFLLKTVKMLENRTTHRKEVF